MTSTAETTSPKKVIIWGGTGAAKEIYPCIRALGFDVAAVFDDTPGRITPVSGVPIYQGWDGFKKWLVTQEPAELGFCVAIGNPHGHVRLKLHNQLMAEGLEPITVISSKAIVGSDAQIGEGTQVLPGALIDSGDVIIGRQCILNLGSIVCHDSVLEDGAEVGPGATVCGSVRICTNAWIGAGAVVLPRLSIGTNVIVGAGAVVTRDIPDNVTVFGNPARILPRLR